MSKLKDTLEEEEEEGGGGGGEGEGEGEEAEEEEGLSNRLFSGFAYLRLLVRCLTL
jgi:hypothetical protein